MRFSMFFSTNVFLF